MKPLNLFYKIIISVIYLAACGFGVFLLFHQSENPLVFKRYSLLFLSFMISFWLLLLEGLFLFLRLSGTSELLTLIKQKFGGRFFFFMGLFLFCVFFLYTEFTKRLLIYLFCISPVIFLPLLISKVPDRYISKFRIIFINITVLLLSFSLTAVLIEAYLHIAKPSFLELNFSLVGDFTDFTSRGYLTEEVFNKKKGVFRILGLGDSFAACLRDFNKNYHNFLQNKFDARYGKGRIEIINAGIEWAGPGYYFHILNKCGDLIKPDLVLVGFFIGNDFEDMDFKTIWRGAYITEPRDIKQRFLGYFRFKNFWLYKTVMNRLRVIDDEKRQEKELKGGLVKEKGTFSEEVFLNVERTRMWICEKDKKDDLEKLWREKSKVLLDIKQWCDKRNAKLIIAILPDQFQVEGDLRKEISRRYNLREDAMDLSYPNRMLLSFCQRHNIYAVDLLGPFQGAADFKELYLIRNTHWNEEGNRLAAEIIYNYIEKR